MRKQIDLNNLLSKYENNFGGPAEYLTPSRNAPVETYRDHYQSPQQQKYNSNFQSNFKMSRNQCEQYLYKIREELKKQQTSIKKCSQNWIKQLHDRFQRNHQTIKKQILYLLEQTFQQHQKQIKEQLIRQKDIQPLQFIQVKKRIYHSFEHIEQILYTLKTTEYRKAIAEIVLKDYNVEIVQIKNEIKIAKDKYMSNLGGIQIDRSKIQCIKKDLQNLFILNKKFVSPPQYQIYYHPNKSTVRPYTQNNKENINQNNIQEKKSFFNFLFDR